MKRILVAAMLLTGTTVVSIDAKAAFWHSKHIISEPVQAVLETKEEVPTVQEASNITETEEPMCANPDLKQVKVVKAAKNRGYAVYIDNKQAIWFTKDLASISAEQRAKTVANTINKILAEGIDPATIRPVKVGKNTFLKAGNQNIVTVDEVNAKAVGVSVHELAYTWANGTRIALGAKPLRKDYADVSRGYMGRESRYLGNTMTGMASWYGPTFHGKRAADGYTEGL